MKTVLAVGAAAAVAGMALSVPVPAKAQGDVFVGAPAPGVVIGGPVVDVYGAYGDYAPGYVYYDYGPAFAPAYYGSYGYYGPPTYYRWHRRYYDHW